MKRQTTVRRLAALAVLVALCAALPAGRNAKPHTPKSGGPRPARVGNGGGVMRAGIVMSDRHATAPGLLASADAAVAGVRFIDGSSPDFPAQR